MRQVTSSFYNKLIDNVVRRYGHESKQALMFARLVESTNDKMMIMIMYNKLINNK